MNAQSESKFADLIRRTQEVMAIRYLEACEREAYETNALRRNAIKMLKILRKRKAAYVEGIAALIDDICADPAWDAEIGISAPEHDQS